MRLITIKIKIVVQASLTNGRTASGFEHTKTQTCHPLVAIVYNPIPLPLLSGSTVLLTDENSQPNCTLNYSLISCQLMASASLDLSSGSFTTWKPALSVENFRLCSSE